MDLRKKPYYLNDRQIEWVNATRDRLSLEEKIGQLFLVIGMVDSTEELLKMYENQKFGGIMFRPTPSETLKNYVDALQGRAEVPVLVAANLEHGGSGALTEGTIFGSQMQVAATGETEQAYRLGKISAEEGKAVGVNLAFAPVCDIDRNWRNPITNTRTYGSDSQVVNAMCEAYMRGAFEEGIAVSVKHFPGDGCDERDQHLVSSINNLSCDEWDCTYGKIYRNLIDCGTQTIMAGHIMQPAWSKRINPDITDAEQKPASCSRELIQGLLRDRMNFQGVVLTDAANMMGYCSVAARKNLIPLTINAGVDMILFGRNVKEDMRYLREAVENHVVSIERIDESVTRILALKASLGLSEKTSFTDDNYAAKIATKENMQMASECADKAITLIKDTQELLPVTPEKYKRVLLHVSGDKPGFTGGSRCKDWVVDELEKAGFEVTVYDAEHCTMEETTIAADVVKSQYDVIMYFSNVINASYQVTARIQWAGNVAQEAPYFVKEIPTLLVNLGNPYGFVDAPMIRTIINTYHASPEIIHQTVEKIMGLSEFKGSCPVDPFCGMFGKDI